MVQAAGLARTWLWWIVLSFVLGTMGLLWFAARYIDWDIYKPDIQALLTRQLGVGLVLNGRLQVEFLPRPRITAANVAVEGPGPKGRIRWLRGDLDPSALLTGRFVPRDLALVEAALTIPLHFAKGRDYAGETAVAIEDGALVLTGGPEWLPASLEAIDGTLSLGGVSGLYLRSMVRRG